MKIHKLYNYRFTKIAEVGIQYRQIKRWTTIKPQCFKNILYASGLTINEFAPHLLILIVGVGLSVTLFIFEMVKWAVKEIEIHPTRDY